MSPQPPRNLLEWARRVQAIAQTGLAFTRDPFDRERYAQLAELVAELLSRELEIPLGAARELWAGEQGYATPKVDVRGGVFRDDHVLLVRERADGGWTLPGGWVEAADAIITAMDRTIGQKVVTYDFARLMEGAQEVSTSAFADALIRNL